MSRLLDPDFKYVGSAATSVLETWKRNGFRPTTQAERNARKKPRNVAPQDSPIQHMRPVSTPELVGGNEPAGAAVNVRAMPIRKGAAK